MGSAPVVLHAGESASVRLRLWRAAAVAGTVTNERDEPVGSARIVLYRWTSGFGTRRLESAAYLATTTDERGIYRLTGLAPGEYVVGFRSVQITLPAGDRLARADFTRQAGTSYLGLSGLGETVKETFGLVSYGAPSVPAGRGDGTAVYPTIFFPHADAAAAAQTFLLKAGDEIENLDFHIVPANTVRVTGRLLDAGTDTVGGMLVRLTPAAASDFAQPAQFDAAATLSDSTGAFTFLGVVPGEYSIRALRQAEPVMPSTGEVVIERTIDGIMMRAVQDRSDPTLLIPFLLPAQPTLWVNQYVSVGERGVADLVVSVNIGARISGRFEFAGLETRAEAPDVSMAGISVEPASGSAVGTSRQAGYVRIEPDGKFMSVGLPADRYLIRLTNLPTGWNLARVDLNGRDVSMTPFELRDSDVSSVSISLTRVAAGRISGTVRTSAGAADGSAVVIVFPSEPQRWVDNGLNPRDLQLTRVAPAGTYAFHDLPDGKYFLAVLTTIDADRWRDAPFLATLVARATRVSVTRGSAVIQDLESARR
jgi:hypothetical protein